MSLLTQETQIVGEELDRTEDMDRVAEIGAIMPPHGTSYGSVLDGLWRCFEILISGIALVLSFPACLLIAVIIRLDSPGPILFRQLRVGKGGRPFNFFKFRTLFADARERYPELYRYQYSEEQIERLHFKVEDDPRITRVGRWLRKSTFDELPNFYNVLRGDMAIVGPRPEIPEMLKYYRNEELVKFTVKPGITGLAQINGRGRLLFRRTNHFDVQYVENRRIWLDLRILFKTLYLIIKRDGAF